MKPEELQIDDLVYAVPIKKNVRVVGIDGDKIAYVELDIYDCIIYWVPCTDITPIRISDEILDKNGFTLVSKSYNHKVFEFRQDYNVFIQITFYFKDYSIIVKIEKYNFESKYYMNNLHNCDIKYIHQLQHAMKLCGINKEIEL
jgi:hypothetical protein